MQHFVQGMQQQAQHAIAAEDQQHKLELHKLMARSALFSESTVAAAAAAAHSLMSRFHVKHVDMSQKEKHRCK